MNHRYTQNDPDDGTLRELLSDLKRLEPPPETRRAVRQRVAVALAEAFEVNQAISIPLWRRTIAVPWPLAAACVTLLFASWTWIIADNRTVIAIDSQSVETIAEPNYQPHVAIEQRQVTPVRRETTTYLCGIGPIYQDTQFLYSEE